MRNPETVTASEIGEFVFCKESLRLHELGHPSANQPRMDEGTIHHELKASAERVAGSSIAVEQILIVIALLGALIWFFS